MYRHISDILNHRLFNNFLSHIFNFRTLNVINDISSYFFDFWALKEVACFRNLQNILKGFIHFEISDIVDQMSLGFLLLVIAPEDVSKNVIDVLWVDMKYFFINQLNPLLPIRFSQPISNPNSEVFNGVVVAGWGAAIDLLEERIEHLVDEMDCFVLWWDKVVVHANSV